MIKHLRTVLPHLFLVGFALAPLIWLAQGADPIPSFDRISLSRVIVAPLGDGGVHNHA